MDAYVVVEDGRILGAGASLEDAQQIADRRGENEWLDWSETPRGWSRDHRLVGVGPIGAIQQIVRVPLAGYTETAFPLGEDTSRLLERDRAEHAAVQRYTDLVIGLQLQNHPPGPAEMRALLSQLKPGPKLRCGSGEAWRWLERGLDAMASFPAQSPLPTSVAARVCGVDVVLDPNMPPNMIRFGPKLFMVDGAVVREIDLDQLGEVGPAIDLPGFTSPRD